MFTWDFRVRIRFCQNICSKNSNFLARINTHAQTDSTYSFSLKMLIKLSVLNCTRTSRNVSNRIFYETVYWLIRYGVLFSFCYVMLRCHLYFTSKHIFLQAVNYSLHFMQDRSELMLFKGCTEVIVHFGVSSRFAVISRELKYTYKCPLF